MAANAMKPPAASIPSPGLVMLAGAAGFEPAHAGTKNRCLTAWLRPNTSGRAGSKRRPYTQAAPAGKGFFVPFPQKTSVGSTVHRSEEHTSELQSLMRISYAVFCLKKKKSRTPLTDIKHSIPHLYT